ncbi:MAG: tyrosine-type recombinase/integrase [Chloroflexi bacterium]|nr:tyrosine-type recombinase/integrase [Chloroflexota bacterium]OJV88196.1 MAG: hypothetical protein BGO39_08370 [Chloroflexi bacterium 54-19]
MITRANVSQKIPPKNTRNSKGFSDSATSIPGASCGAGPSSASPSPATSTKVVKTDSSSTASSSAPLPASRGALAVLPLPATQECPFNRLIDEFVISCRADGLSPKTLSDYTSKLPKFRWWWVDYSKNAEKLGVHPRYVTTKEARAFAAYLREPQAFRWGIAQKGAKNKFELSPFSVNSYGRAIKAFFNWLEREQYIEQTPFNKSVKFTNRHKQDRIIKRVETEELARLFDYLADPDLCQTFPGIRNLAMISFLLDTGIRKGELLSLRLGNLNLDQNRCVVRGKTGQRLVPFSQPCRDTLRRYLQHSLYPGVARSEGIKAAETALWLTHEGKELSYNGFSQVVRKIVQESGVKFHAHRLRHTFATLMASRVSVFDLKELMGHTSVTTTQIYVQQNPEHLAQVQRVNSPLATLPLQHPIKRGRGRPRQRI